MCVAAAIFCSFAEVKPLFPKSDKKRVRKFSSKFVDNAEKPEKREMPLEPYKNLCYICSRTQDGTQYIELHRFERVFFLTEEQRYIGGGI